MDDLKKYRCRKCDYMDLSLPLEADREFKCSMDDAIACTLRAEVDRCRENVFQFVKNFEDECAVTLDD